eukprot:3061310-Rhodomonas_salina.1
MASDTSKAKNLIGELRDCLTKLGATVDQHVTREPNGTPRAGSANSNDVIKRIAAAEEGRKLAEKKMNEAMEARKEAERRAAEVGHLPHGVDETDTLTGFVTTVLRKLQDQGFHDVAKALSVKANEKIDDKLKTSPETTVQIIAGALRLSAEAIMRGILKKDAPPMNAREQHVDAEDPNKFTVSLKVLTAGSLPFFYMGLDEFNGKPVGDNIEMQMKLEFDDGIQWTAKNAGHTITTTLKTEWEFVVNPIANKPYPATNPNPAAGAKEEHEPGARIWREVKEIGEFMNLDLV